MYQTMGQILVRCKATYEAMASTARPCHLLQFGYTWENFILTLTIEFRTRRPQYKSLFNLWPVIVKATVFPGQNELAIDWRDNV